jgi:hypothetical protein
MSEVSSGGIAPIELGDQAVAPLAFSPRARFADWPRPALPPVAIGVYLIWQDERLMYCGVSGRRLDTQNRQRATGGLLTRLRSHWSGRLSGDQFCVYVANQLVIPRLRPEDLARFADRSQTLDALTRLYVHEHLAYQYAVAPTYQAALRYEADCRAGRMFGMQPLLHPT